MTIRRYLPLFALLLLLLPFAVSAAAGAPCSDQQDGALNNPLQACSLMELLMAFMKGVVRLGAIALLVFLVYVGFTFVAAQGNEEKLRTARTSFMWTVIGGAILLGAEAIMRVIEATANSFAP
jgi:hypothetical protein